MANQPRISYKLALPPHQHYKARVFLRCVSALGDRVAESKIEPDVNEFLKQMAKHFGKLEG